MSEFAIIVPETTTNLFTDPVFGAADPDTAYDISATGGSSPDVTRTTADQLFGNGCAEFDFDGASAMVMKLNVTVTATPYTLSMYVKRAAGGALTSSQVQAHFNTGNVNFTTITLIRDGWYYCEYTGTPTAGSRAFGIRALEDGLLTDGWQLENKAYATTLAYGDLEGFITGGYAWAGAVNASTSTRLATERSGGRVRDLTDIGANSVMGWSGGGAVSEAIITQDLALEPGAIYQNNKIGQRLIDLALSIYGATLPALHANRNSIYNAIDPDLVSPRQPFVLRYRGGSQPLDIYGRYAGGMELNSLTKLIEKPIIRIQSEDPFWRGIGVDAAVLDAQDAFTANYLIQKQPGSGAWSALATSLNSAVRALAKAAGTLYVGGAFTAPGNYAVSWDGASLSALSTGPGAGILSMVTDQNNILWAGSSSTTLKKWTGSAWTATGSAPADTNVYDLAVDGDNNIYAVGDGKTLEWWDQTGAAWHYWGAALANGTVYAVLVDGTDVYFGGAFTTIGGVSANRVAKFDTTTKTFSALGSGISAGTVYALAKIENNLYIGGDFTNQGDANGDYIIRYDGSNYASMGSGTNGIVYALAVNSQTLSIGGAFTTANGVSRPKVARWTNNTTTWSTWGTGTGGAGGDVRMIATNGSGSYLLGGDFTSMDGYANTARFCKAPGAVNAFDPAITGGITNGVVYAGCWLSGTEWYIGGTFTDQGDSNGDRIVKFNGSGISSLSTGISSGAVYSLINNGGRIYIGGSFTNLLDANGDYISYWTGSAFVSLGTGLSSDVRAMGALSDQIYIGGAFANAPGDAIVRWDQALALYFGLNYVDVANTTTRGTIYGVTLDADGNIYICGADKLVLKFDSTGALTVLGSIFAANGRVLAIDPLTGYLWLGGESGLLAYWDGSAWTTITTSTTDTIYALAFDGSNNLYIGGAFTTIGGITADGIIRYNLTSQAFYRLDVDLPGTATVYAIVVDGNEVTLGFSTAGTATAPGTVTVTNTGTAEALPIIKINGPGTLYQLRNGTTGKTINFGTAASPGIALGASEVVTLDLRQFHKTLVSSSRTPANLISKTYQSDFTDFTFARGDNSITLFISDPTATASAIWELRHKLVDGAEA